jgi:DNA-binding transcriptional LysR family regulator
MNFKQLQYFIAVAEELHFGRAAERLDMAQPPLSRQIKQLEEDLGAILFNRGRSAITLTQAGERLLQRGKSILTQMEDTKLEVRRLGQGAEERLILALPDSIDTGGRTVAKLERLATHNLILYPEYPRPSYADFVLDACERAGFPAPLRVWCMDLQTALSLVSVGEGVCIVPESVSNAPRKGMKFLRIDPEIARTSLSLNYRLDEQGIHVQNFVKLAQKVARKII